jgi:cytoskeleton protein RodZ
MTMAEPLEDVAPPVGRGSATTAGAKLRSAREAAGLTVDTVAQQLKLAPRQVKALEDDDWSRLPGRTFARGFARNYARFVRLDPDAVLALMPGAEGEPALERPALAASRRPMGEMPLDRMAKPSAARFAIPLVVLAIIAVVAYRQIAHPDIHLSALTSLLRPHAATPAATTTESPAPTKAAQATPASPPPVAETSAAAPAPTSTPASAAANVTVLSTPTPEPGDANAANATNAAPVAEVASAPAVEAPLVLTFKGTSWAEVKDAKGRVVLQMTGGAGMAQTVTALPPLELSLGNAPEVGVTFRGHSLDLSPYTRGNVARVSLQ